MKLTFPTCLKVVYTKALNVRKQTYFEREMLDDNLYL